MYHLCTFNIVTSLIYHLLPNVWEALYTISASIFVDVQYWPHLLRCTGSLAVFRSLWRGDCNRMTHIWRVPWMFQNISLPAAQEVRDSSGVTLCIVIKNDGVLYHQVSSFFHESMRLQSPRQSEGTTARDPVQCKRWTYPCCRGG